MDDQFEQMLKYIGLRGLLANWDHYMEISEKGNFSPVRLLRYVVEQDNMRRLVPPTSCGIITLKQ